MKISKNIENRGKFTEQLIIISTVDFGIEFSRVKFFFNEALFLVVSERSKFQMKNAKFLNKNFKNFHLFDSKNRLNLPKNFFLKSKKRTIST